MQYTDGMRIKKGNPGEPGPDVPNNDARQKPGIPAGIGVATDPGSIANAPSGQKQKFTNSPGTKGVKVPWSSEAR